MHKKKFIIFILLFLVFTLLLGFLGFKVCSDIRNKMLSLKNTQSIFDFAENHNETVFSIDKIVYFSSANANTSINSNSSFTISNLYQYTDIAIFIDSNSNGNFNAKNTLKEVTISNINYSLKPDFGTPNLYFKSINDFAKSIFDENNIISDTIKFDTTSEDKIDYSSRTLYNNCANPISLSYVNSNIKESYTLNENMSNLSYNGSLLKSCNVTLNSIACKISFVITIINNLDEVYTCPMTLNIPLSTESSTVYDGSLTLTDDSNYIFIKETTV